MISCHETTKKATETNLITRIDSLKHNDSLPLKISYAQFEEKCVNYVTLFKRRKKFTIEECIDIVRLDNSLYRYDLYDKGAIFPEYRDLFRKYYIRYVDHLLEADEVTKGMGLYSKKYNLYISSVYTNNNSLYLINGLSLKMGVQVTP